MEELLNKLIEKGWKPFENDKIHSFEIIYVTWKILNIVAKRWRWQVNKHYSIRDICSKSSWLWQFVCENHLYIYKIWENKNFIQDHFKNEYNECCYQYLWDKSCYEYYLLESALCDEDKLESFILDNIII